MLMNLSSNYGTSSLKSSASFLCYCGGSVFTACKCNYFCSAFHLFISLQPVFQFSAQLGAMQHLKDQLEQRTRMIEANIHRQQEELRKIQEQLQIVHGQGLQVS